MKKITLILLIIITIFTFSGCSKLSRIYTETQNNLLITYIYDETLNMIVSKNVYHIDTGISVEYTYFHHHTGCGTDLIGVSAIAIDGSGQIISEFEDRVQ